MPGPAARLGDMTAHGGAIVMGCPTVLIGGMPAARASDMHVCPLVTVLVPHVGGPILPPGVPTVLIGGMPAATLGDMATCVGPPDVIALGCTTVLIGTGGGGAGGGGAAGGGAANAGAHSAIVGPPGEEAVGLHWIEYQFVDSVGNPIVGVPYEYSGVDGLSERGVLAGEGRLRRGGYADEGECSIRLYLIHNAKWSKTEAEVGDELELSVEVAGFDDGTEGMFLIYEKDLTGGNRPVEQLPASVEGGKMKASWRFQYRADDDEYIAEQDEYSGYSAPEYYFIAQIEDAKARSDILIIHDWIEITLKDEEGKLLANEEYIVYLSNGEIRKGKLDGNAYAKLEKVPPRAWRVEFPNIAGGRAKK